MKKIVLLFLGISTFFVKAQHQGVNIELKKELDEILRLDQTYRKLFDPEITSEKRDEVLKSLNIDKEEFKKKNWMLVAAQDSINLRKVEHIISKYGYPGKTLVGEPTNKAVWSVIQHSNKIGKYLPLIKEAGKKQEIPFTLVAMMEDRFLMSENKEQIYGTQGAGERIIDKDGKETFVSFIWPIRDPGNVDKKRKEAGFTSTVEEYAKSIFGKDFKYEPYTLQQVSEIRRKIK